MFVIWEKAHAYLVVCTCLICHQFHTGFLMVSHMRKFPVLLQEFPLCGKQLDAQGITGDGTWACKLPSLFSSPAKYINNWTVEHTNFIFSYFYLEKLGGSMQIILKDLVNYSKFHALTEHRKWKTLLTMWSDGISSIN